MPEDPSIAAVANTEPEEVPIPPEAVRAELQRILASNEFRGSKRCQDFLAYVVEHTLTGSSHKLKERTIGIEVFGRALTYDTNEDGMVRIKASEVRKRLTLYYAGTGKNSDLRVEIPLGAYVPTFSRSQPPTSGTRSPSQNATRAPEKKPDRHIWRRIGFAVAVVMAASAIFALWYRPHHAPSLLDQFWEPVLRSSEPVLLTAAYAPVYLPLSEENTQHISHAGFIRLEDQYVGGGDLVATSRISGMLSRSGHPYVVRMGSAFQDLSGAPSILIGYSSTQWQEVTKDLRFFIDDDDRGLIRDFGKATDWYPRLTTDRHTNEDYAIISRSQNPQTHSMLVLVTGCTQYGTEAAADLITNPELFTETLRGIPDGWQQKNLQLVLQVKVIANSPASTKLIAAYSW